MLHNSENRIFAVSAAGKCVSSFRRVQIGSFTLNALLFAVSGISAFLLRFDFHIPLAYRHHLLAAVLAWVAVKSIVFARGRMSHNDWRQASGPDILAIVGYNLFGSLIAIPVIWLTGPVSWLVFSRRRS